MRQKSTVAHPVVSLRSLLPPRPPIKVCLELNHEEFEDLIFTIEMALDEEKELGNVFEPRSKKRVKHLFKMLKDTSNKIGPSPELAKQSQQAMDKVSAMLKKGRKAK